jgi:hypothetical protein
LPGRAVDFCPTVRNFLLKWAGLKPFHAHPSGSVGIVVLNLAYLKPILPIIFRGVTRSTGELKLGIRNWHGIGICIEYERQTLA